MRRTPWLALVLFVPLVGVTPQCRADSILIYSDVSAIFDSAGQPDQKHVSAGGEFAASVSASAAVGPNSASVNASGQLTRAADGQSGQFVYRATSSTSVPDGVNASSYATAGVVGNFSTHITAPVDSAPLYVVYGVSSRSGFQGAARLNVSLNSDSLYISSGQTGTLVGSIGGGSGEVYGSLPLISGAGDLDVDMLVTWGIGKLPYLEKDNPLLAGRWKTGGDASDPPPPPPPPNDDSGPADVTGAYFHIPVTHGFGVGNILYFDPTIARGYLYQVEGTRFAQFTIPDPLPGGDSDFQLSFDGHLYSYHVGDIFDFTLYNPDGLSSFYLLGIDESEMIDPDAVHAPFVSGLSFTTEGVAQVWQTPLLSSSAVPEPSSVVMLGLGSIGMFGVATRRRSRGFSASARIGEGS